MEQDFSAYQPALQTDEPSFEDDEAKSLQTQTALN